MTRRCGMLTVIAAVVVLGTAGVAAAQNNVPFSQTYRRPAVSPYTMLANGSVGGGVNPQGTLNPLVYQQLIQPREEQERQFVTQIQQGRQINNLQGRVQQIQRDTSARQVNEQIRPTGHASTYLNMSHFYPGR